MHAVTPADEPLRVVVVSGEPGGIGTALCLPTRLRRRLPSRVSDMTVIHRGEPLLCNGLSATATRVQRLLVER